MPRGDGTGPNGMGPGTGRGMGGGNAGGRGRNSGDGYGSGGMCICAKCGTKLVHRQGEQCTKLKCPNCGQAMIREELLSDSRKGSG
jgi:predicted RNA-binding Zn-ribbon protein involved in translation (DUF1610 family)